MWAVFACIRDEHSLGLVVLAAAICVVASVTALRFHRRTSHVSGAQFMLWAMLTGVVAGAGVWSTHFIAMLAYSPDLPIRYNLGLTAASLGVAVLGVGAGLGLSAWRRESEIVMLGGAIAGLGVAAMHFVGVSAIETAFSIRWDMSFVGASLLVAVLGGAVATLANRTLSGLAGWTVPALALTFAICGLHFTATTAMQVIPDLTIEPGEEVVSRSVLMVMTVAMAVLILAAAGALAIMETLTRASGLHGIQVAFRSVPSGLALFGPDGGLKIWNDAYEKMMTPFGVKLEAGMRRKTMMKTMLANSKSGLTAEMGAEWMDAEKTRQESSATEWQLPDGSWLRPQYSPLPDGSSITVLSDITELKRAAEEASAARDNAEAASRAKSDFLANMSHEIRTPLNGVLGMAQVMAGNPLADDQRERLRVIQDSGASLLAILNDILDLSKVQAGKLELEDTPFAVRDLANSVVAAFAGAAASKHVGLVVDIEPETPPGWRGDALRLRQVLSNLVGNAIKFTAEGTVRLEVANDGEELIFRVRDTGIGMTADQIPRLFEKFSQADSSTTRRYGGTGLGLAICQELVELMGGTIAADSELGRGSCFTIRLPLATAEVAAPTEIAAAAPADRVEADGETLRILAAEDNPTNQVVLRSLLQPLGVELTIAVDGKEAVKAFENERYHLILMDAQMPEMNGVEATRRIRAIETRERLPRTPIVALSANVMPHQIAEYETAGMDGWIAKPIELAALYQGIEKALGGGDEPEGASIEATAQSV